MEVRVADWGCPREDFRHEGFREPHKVVEAAAVPKGGCRLVLNSVTPEPRPPASSRASNVLCSSHNANRLRTWFRKDLVYRREHGRIGAQEEDPLLEESIPVAH